MTLLKMYMGKLPHDSDLLGELTAFCTQQNITLGYMTALGAVKKARLAYYDQDRKVYEFFEINRHLEITNLIGNVSLKDNKPIVHAHITLADKEGKAFGGHLAEGTIVFASEVCIQVLSGDALVRGFDEVTRLPLWEDL
jgi:predicted DNA-binding protein with PD1-like motif